MKKKTTSSVTNRYLQTIYAMNENRKVVKAIRLSRRLESSPSTVHATLARMQRDGLVTINGKKQICLTETGTSLAVELTRKRRLVEKLVCGKLGIPLKEVGDHVTSFIEGMTPLVERKLANYLGNPGVCPHGKPIPR